MAGTIDRCGTPDGMRVHRNQNTPPCKWCLIAEQKAQEPAPVVVKAKPGPKPKRKKVQKNPGRKPIPPCGTEQAYQRHLRLKEKPDPACRAANTEASRRRRQERDERLLAGITEKRTTRKYSDEQILGVVAMVRSGKTQLEAGEHWDMKRTTVNRIVLGHQFSDITGIKPN
jgi:hypothetical protein